MQTDEMNPLSRVREGMHVVDAKGEDVGKVEMVQMGDADARTTAGNEERPVNPMFEAFAEALGGEREPDVPEPLRSRLVRAGYVKIDSSRLMDADRYVSSSNVREVSGDRVMLRVNRENLARED